MRTNNKNSETILSIIIVTYNSKRLLQKCLESVYNDESLTRCEIIVIDNDSRDDTGEMLRNLYPDVLLITNHENKGFAAANNQGMRIANGKYMLLLNPDTVVKSGCLGKCVDFMESNPEVGICGCKIFNPDLTIQPSMRDFPNLWNCFTESFFLYILFKKSNLFGKYHGSCYDYSSLQEAEVLLGAFLCIRSILTDQIGMFDERFFIYSEETDFCYRSKKSGWKNIFFPSAEIVHIGGGSTRLTAISTPVFLHDSLHKYVTKHFSVLKASMFKFLLFTGVVLRLVIWFFSYVITFTRHGKHKLRIYWNIFLWYMRLREFKVN